MMEPELIETERLFLRLYTAEAYREFLLDAPEAALISELGISPASVEAERNKARKGFTTFNKSLRIFVLLDKESRQALGWCGFHTWYTDHARAEIGYGFYSEASHSKGLMSEAMQAILDHGFTAMALNRVEAFIGPANAASLKLIRRFGFSQEGVLRSHYFKRGQFEDSLVFSLLAAEYKATVKHADRGTS